LSVEAGRPIRLAGSFEVISRSPLPYEVYGVKVIYVGRKPLENYLVESSRVLLTEQKLLLRARGYNIPRLLMILMGLRFNYRVVKAWMWKETGSRPYACLAVLLETPMKMRVGRMVLKSGDRLVYEGGRWKVV